MSGGSTTYSFDQPGSASNMLAQIVQAQYQNYQAQFVPEENKLINWATDPNVATNAAKQAQAISQNAAQTQTQVQNKQITGSGIMLTPQQKAILTRQNQIAGTVASDDSANRAGIAAYDNQSAALSGSQSPAGILPMAAGGGSATQPPL